MHSWKFRYAALLVCAVLFAACGAAARADEPISLTVDASQAPTQNVLQAHEVIPVKPGPLTLYYPEWIPGEHMPVGPIANLSGLVFKANGATIPWNRDVHDMYAFHLTIPAGARDLDVDMTYLGATFGRYSSNRLASSNMGVIIWDQSLLYPSTGTIQDTTFRPTLIVPGTDWKFATALTGAQRTGNTVTFDNVTLEHLVDSPLDMGTNYRRWDIWQDGDAHAYLNVFADRPDELDVKDDVIDHYRKLVREMIAMYGARHWRNYNFLLTVSDVIPGEGIEHHESSDDGGPGNYLIDPKALDRGGDLLSHEFNHSWDGKYRMPDGLYQKNLQLPYDDSLLWVYEGMTQYYGDVMSWRDGIRDPKDWPDRIASVYAFYDYEPGRLWRPLLDTAVSSPFLYLAPRLYTAERRPVDFYREGQLMWLKVDSIIRNKTNGKESLDTFARAFFGRENTGPIVKTYDRADIIDGLNKIVPYDWAGFFNTWVDDIAIHPPDGFTDEGWKLVYTDQPQHWVEKSNCWYSLGFNAMKGQVVDVRFGSPAWKAGLGINTQIVAVNGQAYGDDVLYNAIKAAQRSSGPIRLMVTHTDVYSTISIDYHDGPRYPHLVRIPGTPDRLDEIIKPYTSGD
jgi:predicted metalloprotease with PDZ domain